MIWLARLFFSGTLFGPRSSVQRVDMTQPAGNRCSPQSAPVVVTVPLGQGQGTSSPVLDGPIAENSVNVQIVQAPHVP